MWFFKKKAVSHPLPPTSRFAVSISSSALSLVIAYEREFSDLIWELVKKEASARGTYHIDDDDIKVVQKLIGDIRESVEQIDAF
jgi:hypothetical protein